MVNLSDYVASIRDFPTEGILFRDITPILQAPEAFRTATKMLAEYGRKVGADVIVGPESRGFIFGCPTAVEMGIGFVPVRKPGKLPRETYSMEYELEYGTSTLELHKEDIQKGQKVLLVDDLLATGGTMEAMIKLVEMCGGEVAGVLVLMELEGLEGRKKIADYRLDSAIKYPGK